MFLRVGPAAFSQNIWGRIPGYRIVSDPRIINRVPVSTALSAIFSLEVRKQRFAVSKNLWAKTRVDPCPVWIPEAEGFTAEDIPRPYKSLDDPSLLTVYDLLARGRYFFNSKAVHIESEMSCLTLWCPYLAQAMRMCNSIFPPRFLTFVGPFVAEQTTHCYSCELFPIQLLRILSHVVFSRVCKWRAERNRELAQASDILRHQGQLFGSQFHPEINSFPATQSYVKQNLDSLRGLEENKWHFLWLGGFISNTYKMCITPTPQIIMANISALPHCATYSLP